MLHNNIVFYHLLCLDQHDAKMFPKQKLPHSLFVLERMTKIGNSIAEFEQVIVSWLVAQLFFTCSKSTRKNPRKSCDICYQNEVIDVALAFLLLDLNIFYSCFSVFMVCLDQGNVWWG